VPEYLYPGVYVEEVDTGNKPIEGVSTSTVGLLGITERGPVAPALVTSYAEFVRTYGSYLNPASDAGYLPFAVEGFFQNGGKRCFVARVTGNGAAAAGTTLTAQLQLTAVGGGTWGNRVAVKTELVDTLLRLSLKYWAANAPANPDAPAATDPQPDVVEVFDQLSDDPASSAFYEKRINGNSVLVTATHLAAGLPANGAFAYLAGGSDGAAIVLQDYTGNPAALPGQKTGLDALGEIDEISIVTSPDEHTLAGITAAIEAQCANLKDRFAILSSPSSAGAISAHQPSVASKYAAYYYPWLNVIHPKTGKTILLPPNGHVAGIYARSDSERGVHKDPANEIIRGIDSLQFQLVDQQQAILNPRGINVLRNFSGAGNLVWGGRTTTRDPDWKYINVRRLFIFMEKSIQRGTQWVVFENNDEPLWARVRRSIGDFLTRLWMDGMLQGRTKEEAYFVRCDRTTMTQADIDNGRLICLIGVAPVKPAEFVIFRIGQWTGGSEVSE
jgi:phage tail sheath protein FI